MINKILHEGDIESRHIPQLIQDELLQEGIDDLTGLDLYTIIEDGDLKAFALIDVDETFELTDNDVSFTCLYVRFVSSMERGYGRKILSELQMMFGISFCLIPANDSLIGWYEKIGFKPNEKNLYLRTYGSLEDSQVFNDYLD